jgi:hypothetical protein
LIVCKKIVKIVIANVGCGRVEERLDPAFALAMSCPAAIYFPMTHHRPFPKFLEVFLREIFVDQL